MKKNTSDKEWALIARYFGKELNAEEKVQFDQWLSVSEENRKELENMEKIWSYSDDIKPENFNTQTGWNNLKNRIQDQKHPLIRPEKEGSRFISFLKIAASFILLLGIGYALYFLVYSNQNNSIVAGEKILTPIILPDGSKVYLNAGARLEYPKKFDRNTRTIRLSGEAFFEVTRNEQKPFIVRTPEATVKVLGTSFNVLAEENSDSVQVTVETGKVELSAAGERKVEITKGGTGVYYTESHEMNKRSVSDINTTAWKTNIIIFHDADLKYISKTLSKLFRQKIQLEGDHLNGCRMNSDFKQSNLESILRTIHELLGVKIQKTNSGYLISGPGC